MKKITKTEFLKLLSTQREFVEFDCRNFKLNNLTLNGKNFEKCLFSTIVNCTFNECEFDECTFDNAFISECNFNDTSIECSDLTDASFIECEFKQSSLNSSKLYCADFSQCTLEDTSLHDANCTNAAFRECNFNAMKYNECTCNFALNCPEKGSFTAFKKAYLNDGTPAIVELRVPSDALRSSATTRKCRVSKAKVVSITSLDGKTAYKQNAYSMFSRRFVYKIGEEVKVDNFDKNRWIECSTGIHCFITRNEAVQY